MQTIGGKSHDAVAWRLKASALPAGPERQGSFPSLKAYRKSIIEKVESRYVSELMSHCNGDIDRACKVPGLKKARLYQLLIKYGDDQ
jgi:transcriptional regulator with AAA-type ATPase domain